MDNAPLAAIEVFVNRRESSPPAHCLSNRLIGLRFLDFFGMIINIWTTSSIRSIDT